jgi:crossover junction endodeoxyribonuclease RuvC
MIVMGIDPGFDRLGWAVAQLIPPSGINLLSYGLIETNKEHNLMERYRQIDAELSAILREFCVGEAAIESLFYGKNQKTVMEVAQSRGVILSALLRQNAQVHEYSPPQIKLAVTGYGRSDKKGVAKMIGTQLNLPTNDIIDDTVDALAILLTHVSARSLGLKCLATPAPNPKN